jgi:hypothetical protein
VTINQPTDHQIWIVADRHKRDGTLGREMLVITKPYNGQVYFRLDHPNGRSTEYTMKEEDAELISAFLAPKPELRVVRDE